MLPPVCASCSGETPSSFGILTAIRPPGWHSSSSASRYRPHRTARWRGDSLLPCSVDKGRKEKHETNETTITEDTATAPLIISLKREISFSELLWVPLHHWPISRTKSFFLFKRRCQVLISVSSNQCSLYPGNRPASISYKSGSSCGGSCGC